jgi:UDP-N-acetylglucosamine 2-epimerase (non-hydrolysing)
MGLYDKLESNKNIKIINPLDYPSFIYQLKNCSLVICDGGSMQEESLLFAKPCIILRKATERQEGLESNFQFLSKLDVEKTKNKIREFLSNKFKAKPIKNPYGKQGLSKRILDILK